MTVISTSPQRNTRLLAQLAKTRDTVVGLGGDAEAYTKLIEDIDSELIAEREYNLEYDLRTTQWILDKTRSDEKYAQNLYAALCNNEFQKNDVESILTNRLWSCSWRSAGGIIANMREEGDYLDWYCTGINGATKYEDDHIEGYVTEGLVTNEIASDLFKLNWIVVPMSD